MRNFRTLEADEIEVRQAEIDKNGQFVRLLLYKTARTDAKLLDETVGWMNWQNDYKTIDGKMYCGIGIMDQESGEWVWKWNCGTESNMESEKGEASDAMKRAGFAWGIGTELYSSPQITIFQDKCNLKNYRDKWKCFDKFYVEKIAYDDDGNIAGLAIMNATTGKRAFLWKKG